MNNSTTIQGDGKVVYIPVVINSKQARQTNGDNFRAMTDEELAEWASIVENNAAATSSGWLPSKWLEWLKKECEP